MRTAERILQIDRVSVLNAHGRDFYRKQTLALGGLTSTSSRTADTKTALVFAVAVKGRFGEAAPQRKTAPAMAGMGRV